MNGRGKRQTTGFTRRDLACNHQHSASVPMRDDFLKSALAVIPDANILVNVVSVRVKQLRRGHRALVESLEKMSLEDTALREIAEGRISYELPTKAEMAAERKTSSSRTIGDLR